MLGTSAAEPDIQYATGFSAPDPVAVWRNPDGAAFLLVSGMEYGRALRQTHDCTVVSMDSLGLSKYRRSPLSLQLAAALRAQGVREAETPPGFPLAAFEKLRAFGIRAKTVQLSPFANARQVKSPEELAAIRASQKAARAAERALGAAIRACTADASGTLLLHGRPFTSERARALVRAQLLMRGTMDFEGSIVAGGAQAADPHEQGTGPLRTGELIVADIFPRSLDSGYWGDMTRTFHHGRLPRERRKILQTVAAAQKLGLQMIRPGITGAEVHSAVARFIAAELRPNWRDPQDESRVFGFMHGLGHGVGLEIHEEPRLSPAGREPLRPGMVVTVEPGFYDPALGGARIEDTVVVTETGCKIL